MPVPYASVSSRANGAAPLVLVEDDNADMRQYLVRLLTERYEVRAFANGQATLEAIRKQSPDLVISDVMMPDLDGFGLLRELRADSETNTIPVILLSARAGEESRLEGLNAGADDYLVKPFSARELLAHVHTQLELARVRREASKAIRENEERLRVTLAASDTGTFRWNPYTEEFLDFDDSLKLLVGKSVDVQFEVMEDLSRLVHPDDSAAVAASIDACKQGADASLDYRVVWDDGSTRWIHHRAKMERDADGKSTYLWAPAPTSPGVNR